MSASIAIAAGASAQAAAASSRATQALCIAKMDHYNAQTATVKQAREYATCVDLLYRSGEPISDGLVLMMKITIILSFIFAVFGVRQSWRNSYDWVEAVMTGLLGAIFPWLVLLIGVCAVAGIQFVVNT